MSHTDALSVALLGMAVVFAGLAGMIVLAAMYGRVARHMKAADAVRAAAKPVAEAVSGVRPDLPPTEPVPDDVLAVIATVIEVEKKLYLGRTGARLTIRRAAPQH